MTTSTLSDSQQSALTAIADVGTGAAIRKGTARALEARGLVEVVGDACMSSGVSCRLTRDGLEEAKRLLQDTIRQRKAYRLTTDYWQGVIVKIDRRLREEKED